MSHILSLFVLSNHTSLTHIIIDSYLLLNQPSMEIRGRTLYGVQCYEGTEDMLNKCLVDTGLCHGVYIQVGINCISATQSQYHPK